MTTASKITLVRVLMIPVFMALLLLGYNIPALIVFIVASCTDFVDGYIARHYNQVSNFGKFLDPLADKLLVISCMLIFVQWGRMAAWAVMIVLAREFAVTGLRLVAVESGRPCRGHERQGQDLLHHGGPVRDDRADPMGLAGLGDHAGDRGGDPDLRGGVLRQEPGRSGHEEMIDTQFKAC